MKSAYTLLFFCTGTLAIAQITVDPMGSTTLCGSPTVNVSFNASGVYNAGNVFTAELSDVGGSFAAPTIIGSWAGTGSGSVTCDFQAGITAGSGIAIRILASDPMETGVPYPLPITTVIPPNAGQNAVLTLCSSNAPVNLYSLLGLADAGGTWTAPNGAAFPNVFDPATDPAGCYTYTVAALAPCANESSTVCVVVYQAPNAGTNGNVTLCSNSPPVSLITYLGGTPQLGGPWSGPSPTVGGMYNPMTMAAGVYTYTVTGIAPCLNASAAVIVNEYPTAWAGSDATLAVCTNGAAVDMLEVLGGTPQTGGVWAGPSPVVGGMYDPPTMIPGVYTYLVVGVPQCANDSATVTVTESAPPEAGTSGLLSICSDNGAVDLFTQLGGAPETSGAWSGPSPVVGGIYDPPTMTAGVYVYTVMGLAPCANATTSVTVTENIAPYAGIDNSITLCSSQSPTSLFANLGGSPQVGGAWTNPLGLPASGLFDLSSSSTGCYTYIIVGTPPCSNDMATVCVSVTQAPNAGTNASVAICSDAAPFDLMTYLGGAPGPGGSWVYVTGGSLQHSNIYNPAADAPGCYSYTVPGMPPCASASATVCVNEVTPPSAGSSATVSWCVSFGALDLFAQLGGTPLPGGIWTDVNATGGLNGGVFNPSGIPDGSYVFSYTVSVAPCAPASATITVNLGACLAPPGEIYPTE